MTQVTMIATNVRGEELELEGRIGLQNVKMVKVLRGQVATLPLQVSGETVAEYRIDFTNEFARVEFVGEDVYRSASVGPGKRMTMTGHASFAWGCMLPVTLLSLSGLLVGGILL